MNPFFRYVRELVLTELQSLFHELPEQLEERRSSHQPSTTGKKRGQPRLKDHLCLTIRARPTYPYPAGRRARTRCARGHFRKTIWPKSRSGIRCQTILHPRHSRCRQTSRHHLPMLISWASIVLTLHHLSHSNLTSHRRWVTLRYQI